MTALNHNHLKREVIRSGHVRVTEQFLFAKGQFGETRQMHRATLSVGRTVRDRFCIFKDAEMCITILAIV